MITAILRSRVCGGWANEWRQGFTECSKLLEPVRGFCGFDILVDSLDPSVFLFITYWIDEESYRAWDSCEGSGFGRLVPHGLKLDESYTSLTVGKSMLSASQVSRSHDILARQIGIVSTWLMESASVFALVLTADGTIHARNRTGHKLFPINVMNGAPTTIWEYVVSSGHAELRHRISSIGLEESCIFRINLAMEEKSPVTCEVGLVRSAGAFVLLGTQELRDIEKLQNEILDLSNELSMAVRETVRKNRELKQANNTIELLARTDALTGLANRRMLIEALPREIIRAERQKESLCVIFADLDHFKPVNDELGHLEGDGLLARLGPIIKAQVRTYDLPVRYGGDEFVLLLPGSSIEAAWEVAERIRREVSNLLISGCSHQITMSFGAAMWSSGETMMDLLARADEALQRAKRKGGNRIETSCTNDLRKRKEP